MEKGEGKVYTEAKKGRGKDDAQDTIQKCKRWWN